MLGEIGSDGLSDEEIKKILGYRRIAVVGFSSSPKKPSHYVPKFLIHQGYEVIPVNPNVESILGLRSYRSLEELNKEVAIVNVFR
ncbi:MAG: CoA-binding protein, partial [Nitrososphaeria archaeon]|nr:CoA-binding protein [Nitrososphaeria archaeon]